MCLRKRILITGGAGFLGSHLSERLFEEAHDVLCRDNFITGAKNNIVHLLDNTYYKVIRHDVQASTLEVYGDPEIHPQPKSYWGHVNPIGFRPCYD